jgi:hypothetical protein
MIHPDAPVYWPPTDQWDMPPTFREAYELMVSVGVAVHKFSGNSDLTPAQLLKVWDSMGFNVNPDEVSMPYIGGWVGCKEWKKKREEIWAKRPHRCAKCDEPLRLGHGGRITHHLDRDPRNNEDDNLVLLCVMCHGNLGHNRDKDGL